MTRMLPPTVHNSVVNSDRTVSSQNLRAKNSEDWACLHSLGLAFHPTKRRAEIDFLLITREGVFVLEVKGGRVRRDAGVWKFIDARGNVSSKRESPFDQASSAMFALQRRIADEFGAVVGNDLLPEWNRALAARDSSVENVGWSVSGGGAPGGTMGAW